MQLLVGLGNPGPEHARQRHNIGFMVADEIQHRHGFGPFRAKFEGLLAEGRAGGDKVLLLKPMTYMNESGRSVGGACRFYKLDPADITVFYDEIDLAAGRLRVKRGGGTAGHNGLRSLQAHLGTGDFRRVRIGIGHPGDKRRVSGHVLGDFAKADKVWVEPLVQSIADGLPDLIADDEGRFMNKVALALKDTPVGKPQRPSKPDPDRKAPARDETPEAAAGSNEKGALSAAFDAALARLRKTGPKT